VLLKRISKIFLLILLFISQNISANNIELYKNKILTEYFLNFSEFSSSFLQSDQETNEEGKLYIKNKRLRIEYTNPSNILVIIAKNKAMYYNKDLEEVEYFNPSDTVAEIFYEIFYNINFFDDASFKLENHLININKKIKTKKDIQLNINIIFEIKPLTIRKITVKEDGHTTSYFLLNPEFFLNVDDKFFSMANPLL